MFRSIQGQLSKLLTQRCSMSITRADLEANRHQELISQSVLAPQLLSDAQLQESLSKMLERWDKTTDLWLFAYGSLIWNPCIKLAEQRVGILYGWHRRFCLWVPAGRGTRDNPGLMLGLDRGGSCRGVALRIAAADVPTELLLVWRREMVVSSYVPRWVKVFDGKQTLEAIAFTINPHHRMYAGKLSLEETVNTLATARGSIGTAADYLFQTCNGLEQWQIRDQSLQKLANLVRLKLQPLATQDLES